ncbi:hypothetical protein GOODEAATRI_020434, partial [Goodea atripinnis]
AQKLLPPPFFNLQKMARAGPVLTVRSRSSWGCYAIAVVSTPSFSDVVSFM